MCDSDCHCSCPASKWPQQQSWAWALCGPYWEGPSCWQRSTCRRSTPSEHRLADPQAVTSTLVDAARSCPGHFVQARCWLEPLTEAILAESLISRYSLVQGSIPGAISLLPAGGTTTRTAWLAGCGTSAQGLPCLVQGSLFCAGRMLPVGGHHHHPWPGGQAAAQRLC